MFMLPSIAPAEVMGYERAEISSSRLIPVPLQQVLFGLLPELHETNDPLVDTQKRNSFASTPRLSTPCPTVPSHQRAKRPPSR
jgi:hypothetical protein